MSRAICAAPYPDNGLTHRPRDRGAALARALAASFLLVMTAAGCNRERTTVKLSAQAQEKMVPLRINIRAEVSGQTSLLSYKWYADWGKCDPQESTAPMTVFSFALGSSHDTVTLDVWEKDERVGQATIELTKERFTPTAAKASADDYGITITAIPPSGTGGADTRAHIAGVVSGDLSGDLRVLVYARSGGVWYIQPLSQSFHTVAPDRTWSTWTHVGSDYAAILVLPEHIAIRTLESIPEANEHILARTVIRGAAAKASDH